MTKRTTVPAAEEILGGYFPVLDHGFVSLVDYMGGDSAIEQAARVSYGGGGTRKRRETRELIRYLYRNDHTTPSEMVEFKFHCSMPIFVARQWIRHRTASVNEMSGRYSILPLLYYTPARSDSGRQSGTNKQGRDGSLPCVVYDDVIRRWQDLRKQASNVYEWMLSEDVARELARIDLPLSIYTQWYWKIDLHNLLHFLALRVDPHAQLEIRAFGEVMAGMLKRVAPLAYEAWIDYVVTGAKLSGPERTALALLVESNGARVAVQDDATSIHADTLVGMGLSKREVAELATKLAKPQHLDFELDLESMTTAAEMERRQRTASL